MRPENRPILATLLLAACAGPSEMQPLEGLNMPEVERSGDRAAATDSNPYTLHIAPQLGELSEKVRFNIGELIKGAMRAEEFFGFEAGEKLEEIHIIRAQRVGACFFSPPAAIACQYFMLGGSDLDLIGFHETIHLLDNHTGLKLSGGKFAELHSEIKEDAAWFLEALDERNFLPRETRIGHSATDNWEFLASFASSLAHPDLDAALRSHGPEFAALYRRTAETLLETCDQMKAELPAELPIRSRLLSAIAACRTDSSGKPSGLSGFR